MKHKMTDSDLRDWLLLVMILTASFLSGPAHAQTSGTGAITGVITDPSGAVVPHVPVEITSQETGSSHSAISSASGTYTASLLLPGKYSVTVEAAGFEKMLTRDVVVVATETTVVNVQLRVGTASSEVTVTATPQLLQTQNPTMGRVTDSQTIEALPLANGNFTQILALSPGVTVELPNAGNLGLNTQNVSTNGAKTTANGFQYNGVDGNNIGLGAASGSGPEAGIAIPAPETIEEFKVQTGLYDSGYGRSTGANVDMVSKSGTNQLHGALWEYFRNDALNANDFFLKRNGQPRPVLRQNQFGFTLGGPIRKDKDFFFGSYQGTLQSNGVSNLSTQSSTLPLLTNDRSAQALGALYAGQSGVFGGVAVAPDGSNINPVALALLNFKFPNGQYAIPNPQTIVQTSSGPIGQSSFSIPAHFREDQFTGNLDHIFSSQNQLAARFFYARDPETTPFTSGGATLPGWGQDQLGHNAMAILSDTHAFKPNLINVARFGYIYFNGDMTTVEPITNSDLGITSPTGLAAIPTIDVAGLFEIGANGTPTFRETTNMFVAQDTVSLTVGKQDIRMGVEAKRHQLNTYPQFFTEGILVFLSVPDFLLGQSAAQNGSSLSNIYETYVDNGIFSEAERYTDWAGFFQDDIKVTSKLTVNAGLRYEYFGPPSEIHGVLSNFNPSLADPVPSASGTLTGIVVASNYHGPLPAGVTKRSTPGLWNPDYKDLGPRIGFAYQPFDKIPVVLRGGYGIYYERLTALVANQADGNPPYGFPQAQVGSGNAASTFQVPVNPPVPPLSAFPVFVPRYQDSSFAPEAVATNLRSPYLQEYALNVQYEIRHDLLWEIGYVGSNTHRNWGCIGFNQAGIATPQNPIHGQTTTTNENLTERVPILGISSGAIDCQTVFDANYNSLQTSVTKRMGHGLNLLASYTWSRSLDYAGGYGLISNSDQDTLSGDQNNIGQAYGPSNFDRPQRFVLSFYYQTPNVTRGAEYFRRALSHWQFSGIAVLESGLPITVIDSSAGSVYGVSPVRAECTGADPSSSGSVESRLNNWFNPAAFTNPPVIGDGTGFGNCGKGLVRGPSQRNLDFSIQRSFPLAETLNLQFRTDFFNLTNTPNFGLPDNDHNSASFGVISTTASNPRILQFALKLLF
jgi:hypothetical protein